MLLRKIHIVRQNMSSIFAGFGNIFNEINITVLVPFFTVKFLCNDVLLTTYEACSTRKFSFTKWCTLFFFSELTCHFQNYQCTKTQKASPKTSIKLEEML